MSLFDDDCASLEETGSSSQSGLPAAFPSAASADSRGYPSNDAAGRRKSASPTFPASGFGASEPLGKPEDACDPGPVSGCSYSLDERHMIWRKNAALHYSAVLSHKVEWPSMTVEFLTPPSSAATGRSGSAASVLSLGDSYVSHRLLLGTCTNGEEKNYLTIAELRWPVPSLEEDPLKCETYSGFIPPRARARSLLTNASLSGSTASASLPAASASLQLVPSLETKARILHPGDLIRATHMPQNAFNIVTINEDGVAMYWNFSRHPSFPAADQLVAKPQFLLAPPLATVAQPKLQAAAWMSGGDNGGFLFSCTDTGLVSLWDLRKSGTQHLSKARDMSTSSLSQARKTVYGGGVTIAESTPEISPVVSVSSSSPSASLNDIKVHPRYPVVVATAGEDGALRVFDMRQAHREALAAVCSVSPLCFSPSPSDSVDRSSQNAATSSPQPGKQRMYVSPPSEGTLALNAVSFNRYSEHVVAVGSARGLVSLFDLRLLSRPFLSLSHHSDEVTSLHFSPLSSGLLASASADGDVVLWELGEGASGTTVSTALLRDREKQKPTKRCAESLALDVAMAGQGAGKQGVATRACEGEEANMDEAENENRENVNRKSSVSPSRSLATRRHRFFVHAGHAAGVSDFAWCSEAASAGVGGGSAGWGGRRSEMTEKGRIGTLLGASVGWDNRVQIWQPSEHLFVQTNKDLW
ncbi:WD domain, G-beta repeat-containing protein [Toxoplasma gondii RUB]|uniref:WD domain, G-beta repeat-containing protein n=1 Tax=Toxoplasma gondii RUB TaxID=935652 RepID=A0A086LPK5_TOXGO|nr:WD domain, G-beta repeat-containing protein [Toxoplasma gondii RUB]